MDRLLVPPRIQKMDSPLVLQKGEEERGLGYQNTLVSTFYYISNFTRLDEKLDLTGLTFAML